MSIAKDNNKEVNEIKFDAIDKELERQEKRIDGIEGNMAEVTKLSTLMEMQIDMNRNQDDLLRQQSETLGKINENLTSLNNVTVNLDRRIGDLEDDFKADKEKNIIDTRDIVKRIFIGIIIGVAGVILGVNGIPFLP